MTIYHCCGILKKKNKNWRGVSPQWTSNNCITKGQANMNINCFMVGVELCIFYLEEGSFVSLLYVRVYVSDFELTTFSFNL